MLSFLPQKLKRAIKGRLKSLRQAHVRRWHAFSRDDFLALLARLGVRPGDVLVVHSSADRFEGFQGTLLDVIAALQQAIGPGGTLLMPTLPFGGSALDYAREGRIFDVVRTPSRVGLITEVFRRSPTVKRSLHPTHSVAVWGAKAGEMIAGHELATTPCGRDTPWGRLLDHQGKILLLGTGISAMTFFHTIEEILEPVMPFSLFTTETFLLQSKSQDGAIVETRTRLFDRRYSVRRDLDLLASALKRRGSWRQGRVGQLEAILLEAHEVLEAAQELAGKGIYCYRSGAAGENGAHGFEPNGHRGP
jgi:aminoglycoside 3-N-acetyltransferase